MDDLLEVKMFQKSNNLLNFKGSHQIFKDIKLTLIIIILCLGQVQFLQASHD
jgi:hypothetical protein